MPRVNRLVSADGQLAVRAVVVVPPTLQEVIIIHRGLHDPAAPSEIDVGRFGRLRVSTTRWRTRKVDLPHLGAVCVVDRSEAKQTQYAERARAGKAITWWNPMDGNDYAYNADFSAMVESWGALGDAVLTKVGRWPPMASGAPAPV